MIKLKNILKEARYVLLLGVVENGDVVHAEDISKDVEASHYDYKMMYGARFKYDSGDESVDWTNVPTDKEKLSLENYLRERGYNVKNHYIGTEKRCFPLQTKAFLKKPIGGD